MTDNVFVCFVTRLDIKMENRCNIDLKVEACMLVSFKGNS